MLNHYSYQDWIIKSYNNSKLCRYKKYSLIKINTNKARIKYNKIIKIVTIYKIKYLEMLKIMNRLNGKLTTKKIILY